MTAVSHGSPPRLWALLVSSTGCVRGVSGEAQDSPSSVFQQATCPGHPTVSHPVHGLCEFYCSFITLVRKGLTGPGHVFLIPQKTLTDYVPMSILQRARGPEGICSCLKSLSKQVAN